MVKTYIFILAVALVFMPLIRFGAARTADASIPFYDKVLLLGNQVISTDLNKTPVSSFYSQIDECYDVPLKELASCRNEGHAPPRYYRAPLDECYDVPLKELASCRNEGHAPPRYYRAPLDECYDVPLKELASCRIEGNAPVSYDRSPPVNSNDVVFTRAAEVIYKNVDLNLVSIRV